VIFVQKHDPMQAILVLGFYAAPPERPFYAKKPLVIFVQKYNPMQAKILQRSADEPAEKNEKSMQADEQKRPI
jgi:hypothetical protein